MVYLVIDLVNNENYLSRMKIKENVILAPFTTFKVGGPADFYCRPENYEEIREAILFAKDNGLKTFKLGGGSNVLISENGFRGLVIHLASFDKIKIEDCKIITGPSLAVDTLAEKAAINSLSGLEFAGGLPGSIGGAVYMNARAYGDSFENIVESLGIIKSDGNLKELSVEELNYSYKSSSLMNTDNIIIKIVLKLKPGLKKDILNKTQTNKEKRINNGQFIFPNAGCVFKNNYDIGIPSGKIIDELGLRGTSIGGAMVFEKHGNFIVNKGNATADDIRELVEFVKKTVLEKKSITLEEEIRYVGF